MYGAALSAWPQFWSHEVEKYLLSELQSTRWGLRLSWLVSQAFLLSRKQFDYRDGCLIPQLLIPVNLYCTVHR